MDSFVSALKWYVKQALIWGGGLIAVICTVLWYYQDSLLYYPSMPGLPKRPEENPEGFRSPKDYKIDYEDMYAVTADGIRVHGWLLKQKESPDLKPTIIFFHGNAGNIGFRLMNASQMYHKLDCNILLVDYRGYGNSEGNPTEEGLKLDAAASLQYVASHPDINIKAGVFAFGRSLGGAVAVALAESNPHQVRAIIVENTFLSISKMVDAVMPTLIQVFKPLVLRIKWSNAELMPQLKQPILFLQGAKDELVPPDHMKELFTLARKVRFKDQYIVDWGTHNDTWHRGGEAYYLAIKRFINKVQEEHTEDPQFQISQKISSESTEDNQFSCEIEMEKPVIPIMPNLFGKEKRH